MTIHRYLEGGLLVLDVGARTSYDELEQHLRAGFGDTEFLPGRGVLLLSNATRFTPRIDELRRASRFFTELLTEISPL